MKSFLRLVASEAPDIRDEHDQVFISRYESLLAYARRLAGDERGLADDLIQDAYIHFTLTRPALAEIGNLNGYLITLVRNLHISWSRRSAAHRSGHVAVCDYDSAALALGQSTVQESLRARESLTRICEFACARKEASKAASVLLLRFFHDFYPSEVAQILRVTPQAVNSWIWQARRELREWSDNPRQLTVVPLQALNTSDPGEFIALLRSAIFASSRPPCLSEREVKHWPAADDTMVLDVGTMAHVASCRDCLGRICAHLELSSIDAPDDPDDGRSGPRNGTAAQGKKNAFRKGARRRALGIREHRPRQLLVSVNGHLVGVVHVESARTEVHWTVRLDEPVAFAELHSEQGLRMTLLQVEQPPNGHLVQSARLELSEGRCIEMALDFSGLHPMVAVEYVDPALVSAVQQPEVMDSHHGLTNSAEGHHGTLLPQPFWWSFFWKYLRCPYEWSIATGGALLLLAGVVWWWTQFERSLLPDPATLIAEAAMREVTAVGSSQAVRRVLQFDVRQAGTQAVTFTHRIEVWSRADTGGRAVRVFDRTGHLVGGQWRIAGRSEVLELGLLDDVWQADLSAASFRERYMVIGPCDTTADPATYTISCSRPAATGLLQLVHPAVYAQSTAGTSPSRAQLTLRRPDLHAARLVLSVRLEGVEHVVTIQEERTEYVPLADVPTNVFTRDAPRLPSAASGAGANLPSAPETASPSLEVRLVELVDRLAAGQYLSVSRTSRNGLSVSGLVSSAAQKEAVLDAVSELDADGLIHLDVLTFQEAATQQQRGPRQGTNDNTQVRLLESRVAAAPIDAYIRSRVPAGVAASATIRELTRQVLAASERTKRHALALSAFLDRFDNPTLASLDTPGKLAWQGLFRRHTAECLAALQSLDSALAPYFEPRGEAPLHASDTLQAVTGRLANEATTIDDAIAAAFTASDSADDASRLESVLDVRQHIYRALADARLIDGLIQP
jgi:RNA polymerase sigma factor (sigma-70 family)